MSEINDKMSSYYESLTWEAARKAQSKAITRETHNKLGKNEFMKLLITQLQNQDPLQPQDNVAYIAQLAQFSSLEGIQNLNQTVANFGGTLRSSQALQASALVGRKISVDTDLAKLPREGEIVGNFEAPSELRDVKLFITNERGGAVREVKLGNAEGVVHPGQHGFIWDGHDEGGNKVPTGSLYRFNLSGYDPSTGNRVNLPVKMRVNIDSVSLGKPEDGNKIMLNIAGVGSMPLDSVEDFY